MDWQTIVNELPSLSIHGVLVTLVYLLWRRQQKLEAMLMKCLKSGGVVSDEDVAALDKP